LNETDEARIRDSHLEEIALALLNQDITFFVGTGFSRFLTDNNVPSWVELLYKTVEKVNDEHDSINGLGNTLFIEEDQISITENLNTIMAAQLLEDAFIDVDLDIRVKISEVIEESTQDMTINKDNLELTKDFFENYYPKSDEPNGEIDGRKNINIITTNYDETIEEYIFEKQANIFSSAVHKKLNYMNHPNIYHIHGEIGNPESIVITLDDYYKFQSNENYLTRKMYSLIEEKTTVILGYSLGDFNINKILNEVHYEKNKYLNNNKIFYIVREEIDDVMKDYYDSSFGIHVIDNTEINDFFTEIIEGKDNAEKLKEQISSTYNMTTKGGDYKKESLKSDAGFQIVLDRLDYLGENLNSSYIIDHLLYKLLCVKKELTNEDGAFEQYEGLAKWLISFLSNIKWKKLSSDQENDLKELIRYSFSYMSKRLYIGYSWNAYKIWDRSWKSIPEKAKSSIIDYLRENKSTLRPRNKVEDIIGEEL